MTVKYSEPLSIKLTEEMVHSIDTLLEQVPRANCPGRSDLIRELIGIGLKSYWKKVNKSNVVKHDCPCVEVHTCGKSNE